MVLDLFLDLNLASLHELDLSNTLLDSLCLAYTESKPYGFVLFDFEYLGEYLNFLFLGFLKIFIKLTYEF